MLAALRGMAAGKRHDIYLLDSARAWTDAFGALTELPERDQLVERHLRDITRRAGFDRE